MDHAAQLDTPLLPVVVRPIAVDIQAGPLAVLPTVDLTRADRDAPDALAAALQGLAVRVARPGEPPPRPALPLAPPDRDLEVRLLGASTSERSFEVRRGASRWTVRLVFPRRFGGNRVYVDGALQAAECTVHSVTVQSWSFPLAVRDGDDIVCRLAVHGAFRIRGFRLILAGATVYGDGTLALR